MTLKSKMVDNFVLRYVRIYPGVNSRAELVTLAPGLTPGTAPRAVGLGISEKMYQDIDECFD